MVNMGDFDFDVELLISLVDARPVLWDKTDDIYKDRIETKKAWGEVCVCLQKDFEALGDVKINACTEYCLNLLNTANLNSYKIIFLLILCTLLFIFLTFTGEQLQHLLANNQLLYSLHCSLLTPHPYRLSIRYIFKTGHCHSVLNLITISPANKTVQHNTGLNNIHCNFRTDFAVDICSR